MASSLSSCWLAGRDITTLPSAQGPGSTLRVGLRQADVKALNGKPQQVLCCVLSTTLGLPLVHSAPLAVPEVGAVPLSR